MPEQWIVAIERSYYPSVEWFDSEEAARKVYDEALEDEYISHAAVFIAKVTRRQDTRRQDLAWHPIREGDPDYDGYCDWCRPYRLLEGQWTPSPF